MWTKNLFKVKKGDLSVQTGTRGLPSRPGLAEVHSHVDFLKPESKQLVRQHPHGTKTSRATCCGVWPFKRHGGICTQSMFSLQRCSTAGLLFFLFSTFYVWLSVGGSGWERERQGFRDKTAGLKTLLKTLGLVDLFFPFHP